MLIRIIFVVLITLCTSCLSRHDRNIVDVTNIDREIYSGMTKKDLIKKIGMPKDSMISERLEEGNYIYRYETNDFTGYTLKIWFNDKNEITHYRVD